jgi:hypothetical protein
LFNRDKNCDLNRNESFAASTEAAAALLPREPASESFVAVNGAILPF